jgi:hypothetical protein
MGRNLTMTESPWVWPYKFVSHFLLVFRGHWGWGPGKKLNLLTCELIFKLKFPSF